MKNYLLDIFIHISQDLEDTTDYCIQDPVGGVRQGWAHAEGDCAVLLPAPLGIPFLVALFLPVPVCSSVSLQCTLL